MFQTEEFMYRSGLILSLHKGRLGPSPPPTLNIDGLSIQVRNLEILKGGLLNPLSSSHLLSKIVFPQINLVVFILVIRQMMGTRHVQNKTQIEKVKTGFKASAVILPLLGITWLFGLLSFSSSTVAFKYIFAIFNSLQGLMIFIFHCLLNKQVRRGSLVV